MTPLDLLLSFARMTVVTALALGLGHLLLYRRPGTVARVALTALLAGCVLLSITGSDWPAIWKSSIGGTDLGSTALSASAFAETGSIQRPSFNAGGTLGQLGQFLRQLDRVDTRSQASGDTWIMVAVCCAFSLPLGRIVYGLIATARVHRHSLITSDARLEKLKCELHATARESSRLIFRTSDRIDAPCVTAFAADCVYLPNNWSDYSDAELAAAVAHEVGHLRGGDARWRLFAQIATAIQFFHPFSHKLLGQLILGQELAADGWAAHAIGARRFVRGISQLALRLDANANIRHPNGIGMSHASSLLIRRITMIRNGLPLYDDDRGTPLSRVTMLLVVSTTIVTASWSVSADEPVRVATRITNPGGSDAAPVDKPWELIPGHTGYWYLDVNKAMTHPVIGQWLRQGDLMFLTPVWNQVAKSDFANRRGELGLKLENIASIGGSVAITTEGIEQAEEDGESIRSSGQANAFVLRMNRRVDWMTVAGAFSEERVDAAIEGLVGPDFPEETARTMIEQDTVLGFFKLQTDPYRFVLRNGEADEQALETASQIPAMWKQFAGELGTLLVQLPKMVGSTAAEYQKLVESFHELAEYGIVGVDQSEAPGNVKLRIGFCPRGNFTVADLAQNMTELLDASIEKLARDDPDEQISKPLKATLVKQLKNCQPAIVEAIAPGGVNVVAVELDLPAELISQLLAD